MKRLDLIAGIQAAGAVFIRLGARLVSEPQDIFRLFSRM
jgi:hypothetical protein